jgi:hypothetical protein
MAASVGCVLANQSTVVVAEYVIINLMRRMSDSRLHGVTQGTYAWLYSISMRLWSMFLTHVPTTARCCAVRTCLHLRRADLQPISADARLLY